VTTKDLPDDINHLAAFIIAKYNLDGVMLVACIGSESGYSTHGSVGVATTTPLSERVNVIETMSDAAVDLVVDSSEAAERQAAAMLLN